jgi:hypothetical protein
MSSDSPGFHQEICSPGGDALVTGVCACEDFPLVAGERMSGFQAGVAVSGDSDPGLFATASGTTADPLSHRPSEVHAAWLVGAVVASAPVPPADRDWAPKEELRPRLVERGDIDSGART